VREAVEARFGGEDQILLWYRGVESRLGGEDTYAGFTLRTSGMNSALNAHTRTHARTERSREAGEKDGLRGSIC
jgi:hypothetical protein